MTKRVELLLIDPQNDFCNDGGSLYVPGADEDSKRVAAMIDRLLPRLDDIHVTLDQHHLMDVAHPPFWKDADGKSPDPFTIITADDIRQGRWIPVVPSLTQKMIDYASSLEAGQRYPLCIWPPHCLIGCTGAAIVPEIVDSLSRWSEKKRATVDFVSKGSNVFTEHYSAVQAEVPDPSDPSTQVNTRLISALESADMVLIAGEAGSHCVANTVRDIVNGFSSDEVVKKLYLLTDGMSPVPGFEAQQVQFIKDMVALGMNLATTEDVLK